jgi:hypothetical protein
MAAHPTVRSNRGPCPPPSPVPTMYTDTDREFTTALLKTVPLETFVPDTARRWPNCGRWIDATSQGEELGPQLMPALTRAKSALRAAAPLPAAQTRRHGSRRHAPLTSAIHHNDSQDVGPQPVPNRPQPTRSEQNHTADLEQTLTPFRTARRRAPDLLQLGVGRGAERPDPRSSRGSLKIVKIGILAGRNADGRLPHREGTAHRAVGTTGFEPATP